MIQDPAFRFTVGHLATDDAVRLPCACGARVLSRQQLAQLLGCGERLHLMGLRPELWCASCGEVPFVGHLVQSASVSR